MQRLVAIDRLSNCNSSASLSSLAWRIRAPLRPRISGRLQGRNRPFLGDFSETQSWYRVADDGDTTSRLPVTYVFQLDVATSGRPHQLAAARARTRSECLIRSTRVTLHLPPLSLCLQLLSRRLPPSSSASSQNSSGERRAPIRPGRPLTAHDGRR